MKIWEVSVAIDCQTNFECDYAVKENFEVTIMVLPFGCI